HRAKRGKKTKQARTYTSAPGPPAPAHPDEAHLSAQEAQARPHPWVPGPHAYARRAAGHQAAQGEGPQAPLGLVAASAQGGSPRRRGRLSRSADFDRVYRQGRSFGNRYLVLYSFAGAGDTPPRL